MRKETSIVIEFKGGGFVMATNPTLVEIFVNRKDLTVSHILYDGQLIPGDLVAAINGKMAKSRIRYV